MINEKNASYYYVANVANGIADEASYEGMAAGSMAVVRCTDNLNEESALSGTPTVRVRIVQKKADGTYVFSPKFTYADIVAKSKLAYVAPAEQISYWGYNASTNLVGFGTITTGATYTLHFVLNHTRNMYNNAPQIKTVPYKATSTSQSLMAAGLLQSFLRQFDREPNRTIKAERINSGAQLDAVAAGGAATAAVVYGSNVITMSSDQSTTILVGSILRLGTSGAGTAPCYVVTAVAAGGLLVTLDVPYQGASNATFPAAEIETVTEGNWGIKFTGVAQPALDPISESTVNQKVYFDIISDDFVSSTLGTLTEYKATAMSAGSGSSDQVSYKEVYSQFLDKDIIVSKRPRTKYRIETIAGNTYNLINLTILASDIHWTATGMNNKSYINITLAFKAALTYDNFETVFTV